MTIEDAIRIARSSSFQRCNSGNGVTIYLRSLRGLLRSISLYTDYNNCESDELNSIDFFKKATPGFQRENNKWSQKMKIKFVENVLKGFRTEIRLFRMDEDEDSQIIDGLQRLTAIFDFMENKFPVFGDLYYNDIKNDYSDFGASIIVSVLLFKTWQEVGDFYIDMNENITHSPEDIEKAKIWFEKEHNILLL